MWTKEANEAFEILNKKLISAPILAFPDMKSEEHLILTVDKAPQPSYMYYHNVRYQVIQEK